MAGPQRARTMTASRSSLATARATHSFEITGYSQHKGLGIGKFVPSATFTVDGYEWCILFYPDGAAENCNEYVSVFLILLTKNAEVRAGFDMRLVIPTDRATTKLIQREARAPMVFSDKVPCLGFPSFMERTALESSPYLQDDRLVIKCDVTVCHEPLVEATALDSEAQVPPSDLSDHLGKLLEAGEETDVAFEVEREFFPAHRIVLAMRSPVFKAELYGPMMRKWKITVSDMQPAVFKALLHFIYTDSLLSMDDLDDNGQKDMIRHLLVAADKYAMERLRLICEGILCRSLDVGTVATTLALADQHHFSKLKDACVQFILTTNRMDLVLASQGYAHLKRSCPAVIVDVFERVTKCRKI